MIKWDGLAYKIADARSSNFKGENFFQKLRRVKFSVIRGLRRKMLNIVMILDLLWGVFKKTLHFKNLNIRINVL